MLSLSVFLCCFAPSEHVIVLPAIVLLLYYHSESSAFLILCHTSRAGNAISLAATSTRPQAIMAWLQCGTFAAQGDGHGCAYHERVSEDADCEHCLAAWFLCLFLYSRKKAFWLWCLCLRCLQVFLCGSFSSVSLCLLTRLATAARCN